MITKIIEATQHGKHEEAFQNWGKFMVMRPDYEWNRKSEVDAESNSLLRSIGWSVDHLWVLDLQTGEGACFRHGGKASHDLNEKHKVWVCPLFEPFLNWLYEQDVMDLTKLPDHVELPDAEFSMQGYRREGK